MHSSRRMDANSFHICVSILSAIERVCDSGGMDEQRNDRDGAAPDPTPDPEQGPGEREAAGGSVPASRQRSSGPRGQVSVGVDVEGGVTFDGIDSAELRDVLALLGSTGSTQLSGLSARGLIEVLKRLAELSGAISAVQARTLVELEETVKEDARARGEKPGNAVKVARAEASAALKLSPSATGQSLSSSRRLVTSMPATMNALACGKITAQVAHQCGRTQGPVDPAVRRRIDQILMSHLPDLEGAGPRQWAREIEKIAHTLDPDGAARRHQRARGGRHVTVRPSDHGMAHLSASLPGLDAARIRKGLSLAAEKARAHGDRRGHAQIMADLLADRLLGRGEGIDPGGLDIGVIITDRSLLAPTHADAATIEGYGTVPYEHIREALRTAMEAADDSEHVDHDLGVHLRRLYTHPTSGELVALESRGREFPKELARFVLWSHGTCRGPYCDADIRQTDHVVPVSRGGRTTLVNANGLCAQCNQKEQAGLTARVGHDAETGARTVTWTTRYGQTARSPSVNTDPVGTSPAAEAPPDGAEPCPAHEGPLPTVPADHAPEGDSPLIDALRRLSLRGYTRQRVPRPVHTTPRRSPSGRDSRTTRAERAAAEDGALGQTTLLETPHVLLDAREILRCPRRHGRGRRN